MTKEKVTRLGFPITVLVFYLVAAVWIFMEIAEWPGVGNRWTFLYLFIFPAFIHRLINILYFFWRKNMLQGKWKKLLFVIFSIILGFTLTGLVSKKASSWAMEKFQNNYQPLLEQLQNNPESLCKSLNKFVDTQHLHGRKNPKVLHFSGKHFILMFFGGSIDIDGSTIYFDSQTGKWNLFHNDIAEKRTQLDMITKEMETCGQKRKQ